MKNAIGSRQLPESMQRKPEEPSQAEREAIETATEAFYSNPFNGEDVELFAQDARELLHQELVKGPKPEAMQSARQRLWNLHTMFRGPRAMMAGAFLGIVVGTTSIENRDSIQWLLVPTLITATGLTVLDKKQFETRARRAVPEFWVPPVSGSRQKI